MKILLVYFQVKIFPKILKTLETIDFCDRLYVKYFRFPFSFDVARAFFLANKEYTHIINQAQDLLLTRKNILTLIKEAQKYDYRFITGVCNVDRKKYKDKLDYTANLPTLKYDTRRYYWISKNRYPNMWVQPKFSGGPWILRRDIVEKIPYCWVDDKLKEAKDRPIWEVKGGFATDLAFCTMADHYGIKLHTNTANICEHYRYENEMLLDKRKPEVEFIEQSKPIPDEETYMLK